MGMLEAMFPSLRKKVTAASSAQPKPEPKAPVDPAQPDVRPEAKVPLGGMAGQAADAIQERARQLKEASEYARGGVISKKVDNELLRRKAAVKQKRGC